MPVLMEPVQSPPLLRRRHRRAPLEAFFSPASIAVIGASEREGSIGAALMHNLRSDLFHIYPVNPNHPEVFGQKCYPDVSAVPDPIDLAIVATPAEAVPMVIEGCVAAGVTGAIVVSAGFKEAGPHGVELERQIAESAAGKLRIIGPNCLGVMMPHSHLNATFASEMALPGSVGFISQSGALGTAILDWSLREKVGFSAFVSVGSMLDVGWGDLIYYLGDDPRTKSIVIYMESVGDARSFLSAAREIALNKPIILLKAGRTEPGSRAAVSHTGALTGSDAVLNAALRRVGVLRVETIEELFDISELLAKQPRPKGPRLGIITNAGGPGALATDMVIAAGGKMAQLMPETIKSLDAFLPPHWSHGNPVDILGDADPERYAKSMAVIRQDAGVDGALVILTPQAMTQPTETAEALQNYRDFDGKPLLACWMGGESVEEGRQRMNRANIGTFDYPDTAARAFEYMWRYTYNLRGIYETPSLIISEERAQVRREAEKLIEAGRKAQRTLLTEYEAKKILEGYGITTAETHIAFTKREAVHIAKTLGFPVVVKLYSETVTHKSDVGGVYLDIGSVTEIYHAWDSIETNVAEKVGHEHFLGVTVQPMIKRNGYELLIGSSVDPQFGPVLLFGLGGRLCEVFRDRSLVLPPLNSTLARRMMEQTCIYEALKGVRGQAPVDLQKLEQLLITFSHLVVEQRWIREIDINPLLASPEGFMALDARIVLHGPQVSETELPKLAIRPYPEQYVIRWQMRDATPVTIRPIRPEDEPLLIQFHKTLSEQSVYYRYFGPLKLSERIAHERLTKICFNDYDRELALVAVYDNKQTGQSEILAVGRLSKLHGCNEAEFALVVSDQWQKHGLGTELLNLLIRIAQDEKLERVTAHIHAENHPMQSLCRKLGIEMHKRADYSEVVAEFRPGQRRAKAREQHRITA